MAPVSIDHHSLVTPCSIVFSDRSSLPTILLLLRVWIQSTVDVPKSTDQYMEPAQHGVQDVLNISTEVHVFHRTRQTDRAVYWTVPHTSGKELWMEPWLHDRSDKHSFSLLARLARTACTDNRADDLSTLFDPIMDFFFGYFSKASILKLSEDLGFVGTQLVRSERPSALADHPAYVLILTALDLAGSDASGRKPIGYDVWSSKENVQEQPDIWRKTTRDVADPKRCLLQFDVQEFCDNFVEEVVKTLKDVNQTHKKSTSTRAPVAEPSLFISTKSKAYNEQAIVELTILQPEHPSSLVLSPQDLGPIFDEDDEPGPVFDEETTNITSIVMDCHLCFDPGTTPASLSHDLQEHYVEQDMHDLKMYTIVAYLDKIMPEIWRNFVVQTDYLGDASDRVSFQNGYLNIQKVFCHKYNFSGKPTHKGFTEAWNHLKIFTEEGVKNFPNRRQTDRAVYWTVPHTSGKELWLEPWPHDRSDRTGACLCRPTSQDKADGQTRINLGRANSNSDHSFSLLARLARTACTDDRAEDLSTFFDPIMDFSFGYFSKARILKLS
ncbi:hypothetical protein DY000_02040071 [Brassica cretica]|uniref:C2H2-type domain-containing protein n=1 Tax=Brassica cretica TaxID=69181 RepID=A0ABQ7BB10_BRACR|nr:hypothetical protein DY000_02040071 [Brassica cretica]